VALQTSHAASTALASSRPEARRAERDGPCRAPPELCPRAFNSLVADCAPLFQGTRST
jgi:hypothetical protein